MITGELKSQVDNVWNAFWTGGIANPLQVIEQITYLLFIKGLDERQTALEAQARLTGEAMSTPIFDETQNDLRWNRFKDKDPGVMFEIVQTRVFPFIKTLGGENSSIARHMKDAIFMIPTPALLNKVVTLLDAIPMQDRDTKGDLYEYMLGKIAAAGQNGQFRTPRHIIAAMVQMIAPRADDLICDPACGTGGFLVAAGEYIREQNPRLFYDAASRAHFNSRLLNGFDFDSTMLRIAAMNLALHGVENPAIDYRDSLAQEYSVGEEDYTVILANPPFAGSLDESSCSKDLTAIVRTKKTELLFLALFLRILKPGGRAAVIVPDGVLFGASNAHQTIRQTLVEKHKLDAVVSLPSGVFKPYAGVSTAILFFTKTGAGGTDGVWFYDLASDGFSLDDKRAPVAENDLPDLLARWPHRNDESEKSRGREEKSFVVPREEIAANNYDLSLNRYKKVIYEQIEHQPPALLLSELKTLEADIQSGIEELEAMLT